MVNFLNTEQMDVIKDGNQLGELDGEIREYSMPEEHIDSGLPAKRDPFDPAPIIKTLAQYNGEIDKMVDSAMALIVKDDNSLDLATTYTTQAKALASTIKKTKDAEKRPYLTVCQALDQFTKQIIDRLDNLQAGINKKIQPYLQKKDAERREAERKAAEEAAKIQRELEEQAAAERQRAADEAKAAALAAGMSKAEASKEGESAAALVEDAPMVVSNAVPTETSVKTETGSAKLDEKWVFQVINFKEIPDDIYEARKDEITKAMTPIINAKIKAGMRCIPGLKIFKEVKIQTRASKGAFQWEAGYDYQNQG